MIKGSEMDKAIIYVRVSTEDQRKGYSVETQRKDLKSYAEANNLEVLKPFEESRSGWKERARVEFYKMVEFIKENQDVKHIIAREVKRLYRNIDDPAELFRELKGLGVWIHTLNDEPFNIDNPSHYKRIADHKREAIKAEEDSAEKSHLVQVSFKDMIEKGKYPSMAPVGYINNPIAKTIEVDEKRAPMIKKLFERYATGNYGMDDIYHYAKNIGLTNKKRNKETGAIEEGRPLGRADIRVILQNIFYYGTFEWKGKRYDNKGNYKPIITKKLFDRCERVRDGRVPHRQKYGSKNYLFKGLLKCSVCGWSLLAETQTKTNSAGEKINYTYYRCSGAYRTEFGKHKKEDKKLYVKEEILEDLIKLNLDTFVDAHKKGLEYIKKTIPDTIKAMQQSSAGDLKSLKEQKTKLESKKDDIVSAYGCEEDEDMRDDLKKLRIKISQQIEEINCELARIEEETTDFVDEGLRCIEQCKDLKQKYLQADLYDKRILLNSVYRTIIVNEDKMLDFQYNEPFKSLYEEELFEEVHADGEKVLPNY